MQLRKVSKAASLLAALLLFSCTTEPLPTVPMAPLGPDTRAPGPRRTVWS